MSDDEYYQRKADMAWEDYQEDLKEDKKPIHINLEKVKQEKPKKKKRTKHSKENALEKEEQKEIIKAIAHLQKAKPETKYKYEVLIHLMMSAGLRVSEALQARYDWFKEKDNGIVIKVPDKARDLHNLKRDWIPKTKAGQREVIFIDKGIGEKVRSYFINNKSIGMKRQGAYNIIKKIGFIMKYPVGTILVCECCGKENKIPYNFSYNSPLNCYSCEEIVAQSKLHPHALRSTYANNLVYMGVNASTLCYYMGWSDLNVALNYVKMSNEAAEKDLLKRAKAE